MFCGTIATNEKGVCPGLERQIRQALLVRGHFDPGHPVRLLQKRPDNIGHVEDLHRPWKNRQRLGVLRLSRLLLDQPPAQSTPRTFMRQKKPHRARPNDQHIRIVPTASA
jgi:hypothetical protein